MAKDKDKKKKQSKKKGKEKVTKKQQQKMTNGTKAAVAEKNGGGAETAVAKPTEIVMPILPLRGTVVFPQTVVPLAAAQKRSLRLIDEVMASDRAVGVVMQHDSDVEGAGPDGVYDVGTAATVLQMMRVPDGSIRLALQGTERMRILEWVSEEPFLVARVELDPEEKADEVEIEALSRKTMDLFQEFVELVPHLPEELVTAALNIDDAQHLLYMVASNLRMEPEESQQLLEIDSIKDKLIFLNNFIAKELEVLELGRKLHTEVQEEMSKSQREYYLREQIKAIRKELGEEDEAEAEINELRGKIDESDMPEEARKEADREVDRLSKLPPAAAEYGVIKTYLDWLTALPWNTSTEGELDINKTRKILDEDHYDLEKSKERILEYLAVRKLKKDQGAELEAESDEPEADETESEEEEPQEPEKFKPRHREPILCFVGPPGVGKTSLAQSIARALGRELTRMSLGGVRDEAEIRGHRRTYVGAMPGRIIQAIRRAESNDPVFVLDEVDKLGSDWRGDPSSALLEVLDPEQNHEFRDHYLDVAFDLSKVMFIATANMLDSIPPALRDRMEVIELAGYTDQDKRHIARRYLIEKQMTANGLKIDQFDWDDEAVDYIIQHYTREAGVRNLEREIGTVSRKVAAKIASGEESPSKITRDSIREYLGRPKFFYEELAARTSQAGVAIGVGVSSVGGDIMFLEATRMPGKASLQVTGQLGDVMKESAHAAMSYVRSRTSELGVDEEFFQKSDIHIHVPAGAVPKDGPSAGVAITTALISLLTGIPVRDDVAMTGEITLRGQVLPVGGIKEKALAAQRAGISRFVLPYRNEVDLDELPDELKESMEFFPVKTMDEALAEVMPAEFLERSPEIAKEESDASREREVIAA